MKKINYSGFVFAFVVLFVIFLNAGVCMAEKLSTAKDSGAGLVTESGFVAGYGTGSVAEGNYEPVLLIWHIGSDLKNFFPVLENHKGTLSAYLEPQFNPVFERETDIEFGIGIGLKYMYPLTDVVSLYIHGSVGPHYISVDTSDQTNGFIFSDTIGAGLSFFLTRESAVNVGYRFRHMSNAGIEKPNGGIDNHFCTIGYSVFFR